MVLGIGGDATYTLRFDAHKLPSIPRTHGGISKYLLAYRLVLVEASF